MKKLLVFVTICLLLCGCGNGQIQSEEYVDSTTEIESESKDIIEETDAILETNISTKENSENYVEETLENIVYKIPESWMKNKSTSGNNTYYRNDDMLLMVQWSDLNLDNFEDLTDYERSLAKEAFTSSQSEGFELFDEKKNTFSHSIAGHDYIDIEANVRLKDVDYVMYEISTLMNKKFYTFGMLIESTSGGISEYKSNFDDILSSIEEIDSYNNYQDDNKETKQVENNQDESNQQESKEETTALPSDYKSALAKAKSYSETMYMSKAAIYDQLTSEYGEKFSADAAQYAIDNYVCDWKQNALKKAESYSTSMYMSKAGIYDQLTSEYGERFTADEAQYAVDHVKADWKANALEKAKVYRDTMSMSSQAIYDQLISDYGEKFTPEEAQYAIDHLD